MEVKSIIHCYQEKEDWDGNFCSDFCIGCGSCDHFPLLYMGDNRLIVIRQHLNMCDKCFIQSNVKSEDNTPYNKDGLADTTRCYKCDAENSTNVTYQYIECLVCNDCGLKYDNTKKCSKRYDNSHFKNNNFKCTECNVSFSLNIVGKIKCEDIDSKNEEHTSG